MAVTGVVLFSAKAIMVKLAYQYEVDAVTLLLFRMLFALPIYVVILILHQAKNKTSIKREDFIWLIAFGLIGYYLASLFDFLGLQYIKASIERVILFIYPTLVLLISRIFLKKKITTQQLVAILLTYLGIVVAFWTEFELSGNDALIGAGFVALSALTYASYIVGSGWMIPKLGVTLFTSYAMIISCFCVIVHYLITQGIHLPTYSSEVYWLSLGMAVLSTVIPSYLVSMAIQKLGAPIFAIIASFGPISTIILANFFLGEHINIMQWTGTSLVILGVFFVSKKTEKKSK